MPISSEDVVKAYRHILGREPESRKVITHHAQLSSDVWMLIDKLLSSPEYQKIETLQQSSDAFDNYTVQELTLLKKYHVAASPRSGYIASFVGSYTNVNFFGHFDNLDGMVEGLPIPSNFHAETIEWIGAIKSVDQAKNEYNVAEIGAGWGPWLVDTAYAAKARGLNDIFMVGVEADRGHFQYLKQHLSDNGFHPDQYTLLYGIAGEKDGEAFFPLIDSQKDWGASAIFKPLNQNTILHADYRGIELEHIKLNCFSLETILSERLSFNLCHIDVQGSEIDIITASRDVLRRKVHYLVIGTHSRKIEGLLLELLSSDGWLLEKEKPCEFVLNTDGQPITPHNTRSDGTQVWRNPQLD
jgi:FkbM family methyltransferase